MKEIIYLKLCIIAFAIFIAYQIARAGKKKLIGFDWSFYFGLLMPVVALILVWRSKNLNTPIKKTHILLKVLAGFLIIWGILLFLRGFSISYDPLNKEQTEIQKQDNNGFNPIEKGGEYWINEYSENLARLAAGGILTIFVSSESFNNDDYKSKKFYKFNTGLWLFSLGIFLLRKKKDIVVNVKNPLN